jgi:hypothetical protein
MKKPMFFIFIAITSILYVSYGVKAQDSVIPWSFKVKPGMAEWKNYKTNSERIAACQIPDNILVSLSTEDLLELCLQYPLRIDILAYDNILEGLDRYSRTFNGFQEFINRDDAADVLLKKYKKINPQKIEEQKLFKEKFYFMLRISMMELFITKTQLLSRLNQKEKKELLAEFCLKKSQKVVGNKLFRFTGIQTSDLAMVTLLESDKVDLTKGMKMDIVQPYINSGLVISDDVSKEIDKAAVEYLSK